MNVSVDTGQQTSDARDPASHAQQQAEAEFIAREAETQRRQMRAIALSHAVQIAGQHGDRDNILGDAAAFLAFLNGDPPKGH